MSVISIGDNVTDTAKTTVVSCLYSDGGKYDISVRS